MAGATTDARCRTHIQKGLGPLSVCQADPACVPLNLFGGPGTITHVGRAKRVQTCAPQRKFLNASGNRTRAASGR